MTCELATDAKEGDLFVGGGTVSSVYAQYINNNQTINISIFYNYYKSLFVYIALTSSNVNTLE